MKALDFNTSAALICIANYSIEAKAADTEAKIARLRTSCVAVSNCFTDIQTLNNWTWNLRIPTPLH